MNNNENKNTNIAEEKKVDWKSALREVNDKYTPKIYNDLKVLEELRGRHH